MNKLSIKKILYNKANLNFETGLFIIKGLYFDEVIYLANQINYLTELKKNNFNFLIKKNALRTFLSHLFIKLNNCLYGYKILLILKGKGLRMQLKKLKNTWFIYLKLGYSHKIFFKLPKNFWAKIFERRRSILIYSLNYFELKCITKKLRDYYPLSLYKLRGFFNTTEIIKQKKGKSRLSSGGNY